MALVDIFTNTNMIGQSVVDGISENKPAVDWAVLLGDDWITAQFFGFYKEENHWRMNGREVSLQTKEVCLGKREGGGLEKKEIKGETHCRA